MKTLYRRAVPTTAILLLTALVFCLSAAVAPAQTKSLQWLRLDSDITVQPNGDLRIVETNTIRFTGGAFSFGYRDIDPARLTAITDIAVTELGQPLPFTTSTTDEGVFRIRYSFPPASAEERTFVLAYTVEGATRYYERGDQVYWAGVYAARNGFPVLYSHITVTLPPGATTTMANAYGPPFTIKGEGENVVIAEATAPIPSGQEFEIRVQFPHGLISGQAAPWQQEFDVQREYEEFVKPRNNIIFMLIGLALLFGGPALAVVLWFSRGRDPNVGLVAEYLNEPPASLSPGLAGALVDEKADMQDIVATLVDLARRGMIVIQEGSERGLFDQTFARGPDFPASAFSSSRVLLAQPQPRESTSLALHEWALLDALGLDALPQRALSAFQDSFYNRIPAIKEALYQELVNAGYYHNSPEQSRSRYRDFGNAVLISAGVFALLCVLWLWRAADTAIFAAVAMAVAGLAFRIVARFMPVRTRKGAEIRMRAEAFRRYLQNVEKYTDVKAATELFDRYLPYAIAFGLERTWTQKFGAANALAPAWYIPLPNGSWFRPDQYERRDDSTTSYPGMNTGAPANGPAPATTSKGDIGAVAVAPPAPVTLESVNVQLTQSLSSLNSRLVDMFSSVGNTFASHPPPESVTAAKDTLADLGDMFGEWLSNAGSGSSSDSRSGSSSSSRSWSGGGSRRGGSSGGGGGFG